MPSRATIASLFLLAVLCSACTDQGIAVQVPASSSRGTESSPQATPAYRIERVAGGLVVPWSIAFTAKDRMLVTERQGRIRVFEKGVLLEKPLHTFSQVSARGEEGLMGLALDPAYPRNCRLYVCFAYRNGNALIDKVVRLRDGGTRLTEERVILDGIPAAQNHAGCRLRFGSDDMLYVTTGDASTRALAQDKQSLAGKILRIRPDGGIPADNPFPDSPIWSYGHRNPQGLDWHPRTGALFSTEHGPSGFDGPGGGDEVNIVKKGGNYGWPLVSHGKARAGTEPALLVFTPAEAPASGTFYRGTLLPEFRENFFFGALRGEGIWRVVLSQDGRTVSRKEKLPGISVGRVRDVIEGPDGALYFTTSNRDGRGSVRDGDDAIYRIVPK